MSDIKDIKLKHAKSLDAFMKMKFKTMGFKGELLHHLGDAVREGSWFIIGKSGHGKTNYAIQLAQKLCEFGRVAYNSLEQGESSTLQSALARARMLETVGNRFQPLSESFLEFQMRLRKRKSADIAIIDSVQTWYHDPENTRKFSYSDYRKLIKEFPNKLFIFISKWEPNEKLVNNIKHDSNIKICVENFYATIETTRYEGGGEQYDIYPER